jgi:PAS domain S-box-containing protein
MSEPLKILLLQDSSTEAEMIITVLKRSGLDFKWRLAGDKASFFLALDVFQPHVVLAANSLLHFTAMDALKIIREQSLYIAFILTGTVSEDFARDLINQGADNYIFKDKLSRLPAAIEAALRLKKTEKEKLEDQQKLVQSEEKYRTLVERISDGFIAVDRDWRYTYVNRKIGEMIQRDPQSLIGKHIWEEFPDAVGSPTYSAFLEAMREQHYVCNVDYFEPLDLWQENHIYPSPDGLSVFIRDITESKRAAQELQTLKDRLFFHIERSPLAFIEWDEELKVKSWSLRAQEIFGWTEYEVIAGGKNDFCGETFSVLYNIVQLLIKGEVKSQSAQCQNYTKDGRLIWCEWFNSISKDSDGRVTVMSLVQDITERKKSEEQLKKSEMRLKEAQTITHLGNWELDLVNNTQVWSDELYMVFGLNKEDVAPSRELFLSLIHPDDVDYIKSQFVNSYYLYISGVNFRFIRGDGAIRYGQAQWKIEYDEAGKGQRLYGILQDITKQKEAELELKSTNEELRNLSSHLQNIREEERIHIAREIHDELGQQLTGLKMNISLLLRKLPGEEVVKQKLTEIIEQIDETIKSVRRISTSLRPSILDDLGLIAALEWHSREIEKRSEITVNFNADIQEPDLPVPSATGIFRIYQEILTNAVRHANAHTINSNLLQKNGYLLLRVEDDGQGMDLSEPKTKKTLGLLGIKERTFLLGGRFDLQSQPGLGTVISIWIPVAAEH